MISESDLDLGLCWEGSSEKRLLHIHNHSNDDVDIESLESSCICTSLSPRQVTIPTGQTTVVEADIQVPTSDSTSIDRPFSVQIVAKTTTSDSAPYQWTLSGRSRSLLEFEPENLEISESDAKVPKTGGSTVRITSLLPLRSIRALSTNTVDCSVSRHSSTSFKLDISPWDALDSRTDSVRKVGVICTLEDGSVVRLAEPLSVRCDSCCRLRTIPEEVLLGWVQLGTKVEREIEVIATHNEQISDVSLNCSDSSLSAALVTCDAMDRVRVSISQECDIGRHAVGLAIALRIGSDEDRSQIVIPIKYTGVKAVALQTR
ncbi:Ig-like domain-containing protein [Botrimarina colliarenosi]